MARKHTKESLSPVVEVCKSIGAVLTALGLKQTGGNHSLIKKRIAEYGICIKHFTGSAWSKGLTAETSESVKRSQDLKRTPDEKVFCTNSGFQTSRLYKRLIEKGWTNECECCKISEWMGNPLRLQVDHIDGDNNNNQLDNLRFLCPNCHTQTETWGARNKKK